MTVTSQEGDATEETGDRGREDQSPEVSGCMVFRVHCGNQ